MFSESSRILNEESVEHFAIRFFKIFIISGEKLINTKKYLFFENSSKNFKEYSFCDKFLVIRVWLAK